MALGGNTHGSEMQQLDSLLENQMEPFVEIIEQPRARGLRFRYECEGRAAGSIPGESSTPENRTYPKIQIHNSSGSDAIVVVSTVTKDQTPRPHPHSLVGKDCNKGVCTVKLRRQTLATFPNLGIQCAKKKSVVDALRNRNDLRVDPFQTGFQFEPTSFDLSTVKLCFQVFLPDPSGKFTRIVRPAVSQCIYDRKTVTDLVICRLSRQAGSAEGNQDVFLLCDKVNKDDIEVRFYEEDKDGVVLWEARGDFGQPDVHRQYAIVFRTPQYRDQNITHPVGVWMQLKRPSDGERSEPLQFTYTPIDADPYGLLMKQDKRLRVPDKVAYGVDGKMDSVEDHSKAKQTKQEIKNRILAKPWSKRRTPSATIIKKEETLQDCVMQTVPINTGQIEGIVYNTKVDNPQPNLTQMNDATVLDPNVNQQSYDWLTFANTIPEQQIMKPLPDENGDSAQNLLTDLAEGGSSSLQLDSNSLLQYLQNDSETFIQLFENGGNGLQS